MSPEHFVECYLNDDPRFKNHVCPSTGTPITKKVPIIRRGSCSECGGPADELWYHSDWWHNEATDCTGRKTGNFVPQIDCPEEA